MTKGRRPNPSHSELVKLAADRYGYAAGSPECIAFLNGATEVAKRAAMTPIDASNPWGLTEQEEYIANKLSLLWSSDEIMKNLGIASNTFRHYVAHVRRKMNADGITAIAVKYTRFRLLGEVYEKKAP